MACTASHKHGGLHVSEGTFAVDALRIELTHELDMIEARDTTLELVKYLDAPALQAVRDAADARLDELEGANHGLLDNDPPLSIVEIAQELERRAAEGDDAWKDGVAATYRWVAQMIRNALEAEAIAFAADAEPEVPA